MHHYYIGLYFAFLLLEQYLALRAVLGSVLYPVHHVPVFLPFPSSLSLLLLFGYRAPIACSHVMFYTLGFDVWTEPTKILVLEILEIWRSESAKGCYEGSLWDAGAIR